MADMHRFSNFHAHVYLDPEEGEEARRLCEAMRDELGVAMGRVHLRPVGPHPRGSCQMTVPAPRIGEALEWLMQRRGRFTVFCHGNSGDDLADHTAHVMWLGPSEALDLSQFGPEKSEI
jgi:aromatic ring-cleaving dioxygenase